MSYAFCTSLYATSHSSWHLREVPDLQGLGLGGGAISTPSLCGRVRPPLGYHVDRPLDETHLQYNTCLECLTVYRTRTAGEKP
jgi:hypothetical protein